LLRHVAERIALVFGRRAPVTLEARAERQLRPAERGVPRGNQAALAEYDPVLLRLGGVPDASHGTPLRRQTRGAIHRGAELRHPSQIRFGRNPIIKKGAVLDGRSNQTPYGIQCGDDFYAKEHVYMDAYGGFIKIGRGAALAQGVAIHGNGGVSVGDYLMMGHGAMILAGNHRHELIEGIPFMFQGSTAKGIQIGSNVWICAGAMILDGVSVGDNVVIGAGTVIGRDIPSDSMVTAERQLTVEPLLRTRPRE
jgi:acetyltransferase-like isoleucine patch superfamily enzyme